MKKIPKNTQRAYAVASYIATALKTYDSTNDQEMRILHKRAKDAMNVFALKAGYDSTMELADKLGDLWQKMGERHSATINEDAVPALVEAFSMMIYPKEFKDFLGVPTYQDIENQKSEHYNTIMKSVNILNHELNILLGTKSVVLQKPKEKVKKVKKPKEKSKAQKKHEERVKMDAERKQRKKDFFKSLRERAQKAREALDDDSTETESS